MNICVLVSVFCILYLQCQYFQCLVICDYFFFEIAQNNKKKIFLVHGVLRNKDTIVCYTKSKQTKIL